MTAHGMRGQAGGRVKVQNGALQSLSDMTQTGLHMTIQGSLCQIQGYLRLHSILHSHTYLTSGFPEIYTSAGLELQK